MPYRLEKHNFNPHRILGSFEYDTKTGKPFFLKNRFGVLTDKLYRPVSMHGFLINECEDIIDDEGHVRFIKQQLLVSASGCMKELYNYKGLKYKIKDIIGQFEKNDSSKEIIL